MFSHLISQQIDRERMLQALRRAHDSLAVSALTDATTGLPNRRALMEEMQRRHLAQARDDTELVVAFIDLDHFKAINDRYGHDIGDRFLSAIGERMRGALRSSDFVARLGGDEFVALSSSARGDGAVTAAAMHPRLLAATTGRYRFDELSIHYDGPSIGIIVAEADAEPVALLARADTAMYADKRQRKQAARH
jgi:diguanylate cyclase